MACDLRVKAETSFALFSSAFRKDSQKKRRLALEKSLAALRNRETTISCLAMLYQRIAVIYVLWLYRIMSREGKYRLSVFTFSVMSMVLTLPLLYNYIFNGCGIIVFIVCVCVKYVHHSI